MQSLGAAGSEITAAIGPCISRSAYEVGTDFEARFLAEDDGAAAFFYPGQQADKRQMDLGAYVEARLRRSGIRHLARADACTYDGTQRYFSFRRATHLGQPDYGRQLSAIMLSAES